MSDIEIRSLNGHKLMDEVARQELENKMTKPTETAEHQYLTTNENGEAVWEEKLAYKISDTISIIPLTDILSFATMVDSGIINATFECEPDINFHPEITWDNNGFDTHVQFNGITKTLRGYPNDSPLPGCGINVMGDPDFYNLHIHLEKKAADSPIWTCILSCLAGTGTFDNISTLTIKVDGVFPKYKTIDTNLLPQESLINLRAGSMIGTLEQYIQAEPNSQLATASGTVAAAFNYSTASGYGSASFNQSTASGSYSIAANEATASGAQSSAFNAGKASKNNSAAFGSGTASGKYSFAEGSQTEASGEASHVEGRRTAATGLSSHAEGDGAMALNYSAHAEGYWSVADGEAAHAEGWINYATGNHSHAEGSGNNALSDDSHAEGNSTVAFGLSAHTEGNMTFAGWESHAEGRTTFAENDSHAEGMFTYANNTSHAQGMATAAYGDGSHSEGYGEPIGYNLTGTENSSVYNTNTTQSMYIGMPVYYFPRETEIGRNSAPESASISSFDATNLTVTLTSPISFQGAWRGQVIAQANGYASKKASHVEGLGNVAMQEAQHVQGKYNVLNDSGEQYAHIVGNGTSKTSRSNAHTLDWSGNAWYSGDVYVGSTSGTNRDEGSKKLATEEYVNNTITNLGGGASTGIIVFKVDSHYGLLFARNGMTWREWCDSIYSNDEWRCEDDGVANADDYIAIMGEKVLPDDVIIPEYLYDSVVDTEQ